MGKILSPLATMMIFNINNIDRDVKKIFTFEQQVY